MLFTLKISRKFALVVHGVISIIDKLLLDLLCGYEMRRRGICKRKI